MLQRSRPNAFVASAAVLLALSAGINVLQARRIHSLIDASTPVSPAIGTAAPPLVGFSLSGAPREVGLRTGVPTLVYYFSPTCVWCERNWENIRSLTLAAGAKYRLVAVSSARGLKKYMDDRRLTVDVVEGIGENTRSRFGFGGTPHTVVVSGEGVITHDWRGAFTPRTERQIEDLFDVALPGVLPAPVKPSSSQRQ